MCRNSQAVLALSLALAGCQQSVSDSASDFLDAPWKHADTERPRAVEHLSSAPPPVSGGELTHDFGVVRPGQVCSHTFTFVNPTDTPLQSARINRSCTCTVAEIAPPVIEPGTEAKIRVQYKAPGIAALDSSSMVIQFKDEPSLLLLLRVDATIRPMLYVTEHQVAFTELPANSKQARTVRVQNFGNVQWDSVTARNCPNWLTWRCKREESDQLVKGDAKRRPLEEWALEISVDSSQFPASDAEAEILIEREPAEEDDFANREYAHLLVRASVAQALRAYPNQLQVRAAAGESITKNILIKLSPDYARIASTDLHLTHDLGPKLDIGEMTGSGNVRQMRLSFHGPFDEDERSLVVRLQPIDSPSAVAETVIPLIFSK